MCLAPLVTRSSRASGGACSTRGSTSWGLLWPGVARRPSLLCRLLPRGRRPGIVARPLARGSCSRLQAAAVSAGFCLSSLGILRNYLRRGRFGGSDLLWDETTGRHLRRGPRGGQAYWWVLVPEVPRAPWWTGVVMGLGKNNVPIVVVISSIATYVFMYFTRPYLREYPNTSAYLIREARRFMICEDSLSSDFASSHRWGCALIGDCGGVSRLGITGNIFIVCFCREFISLFQFKPTARPTITSAVRWP